MDERIVPVGLMVKSHGVHGEVKYVSYIPDPDDWTPYRKAYLARNKEMKKEKSDCSPVSVIEARSGGKYWILAVDGWTTPEQAAQWVPSTVDLDRNAVPDLPEGSYYWFDLEGMEVFTEEREPMGTVQDVFPTGSNDVCLVRNGRGEERLIPVIRQTVLNVDLEKRRITVRPMEEFN